MVGSVAELKSLISCKDIQIQYFYNPVAIKPNTSSGQPQYTDNVLKMLKFQMDFKKTSATEYFQDILCCV